MMRRLPHAVAIALLACALAATFLLACSGANGDPAPAAVEAGADASVVVVVQCADGAAE
jgi:hypothetical protein